MLPELTSGVDDIDDVGDKTAGNDDDNDNDGSGVNNDNDDDEKNNDDDDNDEADDDQDFGGNGAKVARPAAVEAVVGSSARRPAVGPAKLFFLHLAGIFAGILIMALIGVYEEDLKQIFD